MGHQFLIRALTADQSDKTVMGYDSDIYDEAGTTLIEPAGEFSFLYGDNLLPLDIDAMELLYGGNDDVRSGPNTYIFDPEIYDPADVKLAQYRTSILDDGGTDTYDFSLIDVDTIFRQIDPSMMGQFKLINHPGVFINLNPGTWSTIVTGEQNLIIDTEEEIYQYGQIFTAKDAIIENVIGSAYNDIIYGNDSDNVINFWKWF